jgi:hypothetical protein
MRKTPGRRHTNAPLSVSRSENALKQLRGQRAWIEYHEEQRGWSNNVYLDKIESAQPDPEAAGAAAHSTAV